MTSRVHDDSESDGYDYDDDYDDYPATTTTPQRATTSYAPLHNAANASPSYGGMLNNAFNRLQSSIVQRISPSRTMHTNLATVPEASDEGSDRQSVLTSTTSDTAASAPRNASKFTEHSLSEVRRVNPRSYDEQPDDDPFADGTPRDARSIAYRFASVLSHTAANGPAGLPLPVHHLSRSTTPAAYATGASRSPTPARETPRYRRAALDEEHGVHDDYFADYDDDDDEKDAEDVADSLRPPHAWVPRTFAMHDPEKSSLTSSGSSTLDGAYPTSPLPTRHFGPAPVGRVQRRHKRLKKAVRLTNGNLVLDLNVPPKLVKILPVVGGVRYEEKSEMTKTRYTAVTCDPDDFEKQGFFLRQNELGRTTELFIVITMYNVRPSFSPLVCL